MATNNTSASGWVGWVYFAACLLLLAGAFQLFAGFTALLNDTFYAIKDTTLIVFDITTWGWIHLVLGIFLLCTGVALFNGSNWARVVAVLLVSLNFIVQFAFIGAYPIWSVIIMMLDLIVIYALTVHGDEARS
ncbi:hypothetical protein I8H83_01465 [Candidatus Saccharibacteria bacterium]|nr:hypothetical protein [Candidatus Saccharibacteria bacterium]